jgi:hypothetical protein
VSGVVSQYLEGYPRVSWRVFEVLDASSRLQYVFILNPPNPQNPLNTLQNPKGSPQNTPRALQNPEGMLPEYSSNARGYCQGYLSYLESTPDTLYYQYSCMLFDSGVFSTATNSITGNFFLLEQSLKRHILLKPIGMHMLLE